MSKDRYLNKVILGDLDEKMVFIGGPRQIGKTALSKIIAENNYKCFTSLQVLVE